MMKLMMVSSTRDNTTLLSPFDVPAVGLAATVRTQVIREKLTNIITLNVTSGAPERVDYVEAEFKLSSDTDWITWHRSNLVSLKL